MGKKAQIKRDKEEQEKKSRKEYLHKKSKERKPWLYFWQKWEFWTLSVCLLAICIYPFVPKKYLGGTTSSPVATTTLATLSTSMGDIEIELYKTDAPRTVDNFEKLAKQGFYNGLTWHRIIKDFIIQTGDPNGDGTGGPGYQFDDEINSHKFAAGTVGMANSGANTNGSQFFIVTSKEQPSLDGKYTPFGFVTKGMDIVQLISEAPTDDKDKPLSDIKLKSVTLK